MKRCYDKSNVHYKYYGEKGVKICDEWKNVEIFIEYAKKHYRPTLTIDRIDVDGNYEPSNCRWITKKQQSYNRGGNKKSISKYKGVTFSKKRQKYIAKITKTERKNMQFAKFIEKSKETALS